MPFSRITKMLIGLCALMHGCFILAMCVKFGLFTNWPVLPLSFKLFTLFQLSTLLLGPGILVHLYRQRA